MGHLQNLENGCAWVAKSKKIGQYKNYNILILLHVKPEILTVNYAPFLFLNKF